MKQDFQLLLFQETIIADWLNEISGIWRTFWEEESVIDSLGLGNRQLYISREVLMDLVPLERLCEKLNVT